MGNWRQLLDRTLRGLAEFRRQGQPVPDWTTDVWKCSAWDRAAHYLKLKYPEGEIDFIVTAAVSSLPPIEKQIDLTGIRKGSKPTFRIDPPVEIALKKLHYRATMLKPRHVRHISDRRHRWPGVDREPA